MSTTWNPQQYEKFKAQRSKPFYDLLALVKPEAIGTAVDLGCGTGELTRQLFDSLKPAGLLGIDNSKEMLAKAVAVPGLAFELLDVGRYRPEAPLDLVFSNATLHWLPDHEALFPRVLGWVKPGGQVAVQMPCNFDHVSHRTAREVALRLFPGVFDQPVSGVLAVDRYAEILFAQGFAEQVCRVEVYGHAMPSGREVIEWTRGTLLTAYQERLSGSDFARFVDGYTTELLAKIGEGPYFYAFKRILVWGRKRR